MEDNKYRKVVIVSLAGLLIGSLLYIFGISIKTSIWPMVINYIIAVLLYISSFLAVYNNYKNYRASVFKYIMVLSGFFIVFITIATIAML